jgi:hypothetical protein
LSATAAEPRSERFLRPQSLELESEVSNRGFFFGRDGKDEERLKRGRRRLNSSVIERVLESREVDAASESFMGERAKARDD